MSDTVSKYYELVEEGKIDPNETSEHRRDVAIMNLLTQAAKAGKLVEVEERAAEVQKEFRSASLLLGLQIAVDEILG